MALRTFKPVTPGQRFKVISYTPGLSKSGPEKSLLETLKKSGGRNNSGKLTMRYIGGGHKQKYRLVDFCRSKDGVAAVVKTLEYDPNRTAFISLVEYADGVKSYILAPNGLEVGKTIMSGTGVPPEIGNTLFLSEIPLGTIVHNIELNPGQGGILARSAGAYAQLLSRDGKYAIVKLPSSETRMVLVTCKATIGSVSNAEHFNETSGKAGRSRWLGRRPRNRGVAMNPVDHPMGGGEGRGSGGHPRSRKGIPAKGYKTRAPKNRSNKFIVERRKK